nr:pentatricopeptide repeat protein AaPPR862 [Agave angustifolia]
MIIAFARSGQCCNAVDFYVKLRHLSIGCNPYMFSGLVNACVRFGDIKLTQLVHGQIFVIGSLSSNLVIPSLLVDVYAKNWWVDDARKVFIDLSMREVLC